MKRISLYISLVILGLCCWTAQAEAGLTLGVVAESAGEVTTARAAAVAATLSEQLGEPVALREFSDLDQLLNWLNRFAQIEMALVASDLVAQRPGEFLTLGVLDPAGKVTLVARQGIAGDLPQRVIALLKADVARFWPDSEPGTVVEQVAPQEQAPLPTVVAPELPSAVAVTSADGLEHLPAPQPGKAWQPMSDQPYRDILASQEPQRQKLVFGVVPGPDALIRNAAAAEQLAAHLQGQLSTPVLVRVFDRPETLADWFQRFKMVDLAMLRLDARKDPFLGDYRPVVGLIRTGLPRTDSPDLMVTRRDFPEDLLLRVQSALMLLPQTSDGQQLLADLAIDQVVPAGSLSQFQGEPEPDVVTPEPPQMPATPPIPVARPDLIAEAPALPSATSPADTLALRPDEIEPPMAEALPGLPAIEESATLPALPLPPVEPEQPVLAETPAAPVEPLAAPAEVAEAPAPLLPPVEELPADLPEPPVAPVEPEQPVLAETPAAPVEPLAAPAEVVEAPAPLLPPVEELPADLPEPPAAPLEPELPVLTETPAAPAEPLAAPAEVVETPAPALPPVEELPADLPEPPAAMAQGEAVAIVEEQLLAESIAGVVVAPEPPAVSAAEQNVADAQVAALLSQDRVPDLLAQPDLPRDLRPQGVPVARPGRLPRLKSGEPEMLIASLPKPLERTKVPPPLLPPPEPEPRVVYIVPFVAVMVPTVVQEQLFDQFVDNLIEQSDSLGYDFVILKEGLQKVDPEWLRARKYVTGEIYAYVEDSGCCTTDLRARARLTYYKAYREEPALSYEYPLHSFFDHDRSTLAAERSKLSELIAGVLVGELAKALKP